MLGGFILEENFARHKRKESQEEKLNLSWMDPERVSED